MRKTVDEARVHCYGNDEPTRMIFNIVQKQATMPAMTDVPGWAAELAIQVQGDFMFPLMPDAIFPRLAARGMSLDFGRNGRINIPTRLRTTTIAGSFVGEGQPIPVRQALFAAQSDHAEEARRHYRHDPRDRGALDPGDRGPVAPRDHGGHRRESSTIFCSTPTRRLRFGRLAS